MIGFTKTVALEVARDDITCNAICPGFVETPDGREADRRSGPHARHVKEQVLKDVILAAQPTKPFVTTDELTA